MVSKCEPKICVIGGGTGLSVLLRGLKKHTANLTAVVSVTDDGGSSGRLRRELGILPPGDIRNCLVALSQEENLMSRLFQYRFSQRGSLAGHSFGNLFLTALTDLAGSFENGVARSSEVLNIRGMVLPVTLKSVNLKAELENGKIVKGETNIAHIKSRIKKLGLYPVVPPTTAQVVYAITSADAVVLGPGSLYTSIIANLLIRGVVEAIRKVKVPRIYISNIMTQANESKGYTLSDHINALTQHAGGNIVSHVLVNSGQIPSFVREKYAKQHSFPVINDLKDEKRFKIVKANYISRAEYARHDPEILASEIMRILQ